MVNALVSTVIPAYNAGKFIGETIESVLAQTYTNIECLVVNDGSTDNTGDVAKGFGGRIRYIDKPNGGVATARNLGVAESRGEYIAFLDADDLWMPEKIERQIEVFDMSDDIGMVFCGVKFVDENGIVSGGESVVTHEQLIRNILLMSGTTGYISSTAVFARWVFDAVGPFDTDLSTSADADFICRLSTHCRFSAVDEPLALYRVHGNQMHHNLAAFDHDMNIVLQKLFATEKAPAGVAALRSKAYASLESTLAIGHLSKGNLNTGLSHLAAAARYHLPTSMHHLSRLLKARIAGN